MKPLDRTLLILLVGILALAAAPAALGDDVGGAGSDGFEIFDDPIIREMRKLDKIAPFEDLAPLWDYGDPELQREVDAAIEDLGLTEAVKRRKVASVLVDISDLANPRVASVNGDVMMYAASLPKIAVLLGAFEKIAQGKMELDAKNEKALKQMIRRSSNTAATAMMHEVGKEYIARVLLSPRYRLYDLKHNGGLWVGKDYAKSGLWRRDPLHNLSHGATAIQVARFYYLLATENLVTPEHSRQMKEFLASTQLEHKFARAIHVVNPKAQLFRKSGSWSTFHADSALVERDGRAYIAVALADNKEGSAWMTRIAVKFDRIIFAQVPEQKPAKASRADPSPRYRVHRR